MGGIPGIILTLDFTFKDFSREGVLSAALYLISSHTHKVDLYFQSWKILWIFTISNCH